MSVLAKIWKGEWQKMYTPFFVSKKSFWDLGKTVQKGFPGRLSVVLFLGQRSLLKLFHPVLFECI